MHISECSFEQADRIVECEKAVAAASASQISAVSPAAAAAALARSKLEVFAAANTGSSSSQLNQARSGSSGLRSLKTGTSKRVCSSQCRQQQPAQSAQKAAAVFNDSSSSSQRRQQPRATVGSQKAEGRTRNSECSFEQADRIVQAAKGRRRQMAQLRVHL